MSSEFKSTPEYFSLLNIYKAELVLLLVTLSWGLSFPLIKLSLDLISPFFFLFLRFFITILLFYSFFRKKIDITNFTEWKNGLILGVFLFAGFAFQTLGLKYTSASKSAFITGTALIFIPFMQYFIIKKKPKPENITGGLILLAGLYILSEAYFTIPNFGDVLTLICAFSFAIHIVLLNKFTTESNFYNLAFGQFLALAVLSLFFMIIFEVIIFKDVFILADLNLSLSILYTSVIATMISIILITKYQHQTTPLRAGIIYNMESIFAVFFAFIILGEILNFNQIIGVCFMITGLIISEFYTFIKYKFSNADKI